VRNGSLALCKLLFALYTKSKSQKQKQTSILVLWCSGVASRSVYICFRIELFQKIKINFIMPKFTSFEMTDIIFSVYDHTNGNSREAKCIYD